MEASSQKVSLPYFVNTLTSKKEKLLLTACAEHFKYDNSRTKEILGINFRSLKDMIRDIVPTLQAIGA